MKRKCRQAASIACKGIGLGLWNPCVRGRVPLPAWEQRKLGELGSVAMCKRIYKEQTTERGEVPFFKIGTFGAEPDSFISRDLFEEYRRLYPFPEKGDVLISAAGTIGRTVVYQGECAYYQDSNIVWLDHDERLDNGFFLQYLENQTWSSLEGSTLKRLYNKDILDALISLPTQSEQRVIGALFDSLDSLITLHQREPRQTKRRHAVLADARPSDLFHQYYRDWITVYKEGAVRNVTLDKYLLTHEWLKRLAPNLQIKDLNRIAYQTILNGYAEKHERQTTMDFHHQMKGAILDAVDDGLIDRDPTRKAIIKGKAPRPKKQKYLNQFELHRLLSVLDLGENISWDWMILLIAKTGLRFSEALAITPEDFDFTKQIVSINKTWDYKNENAFAPTKNPSSNRKVQLDWQLVIQFATLVRELPPQDPIFVKGHVYNATINDALERRCLKAEVPVITIHGLRHTHASLLLFAGVSIASVAKRLGHASMNTTEKTYLHVIRELENKDVDLVMRSISGLI